MTGLIGRIAIVAVLAIAQTTLAGAAELKVYSTIAVRGALEQLGPQFEHATGNTLAITWGTAAMLTKRIEDGEKTDVAILAGASIDSLSKDGKIAPDTAVKLASSSIAVAVKAGSRKPDISTPAAFKQALLDAKSIAYSNPASGGASGVYFAKLLESMTIAEAMKAKTKFPPPGGNAASLLLTGEAELAVQQKPEIMTVAGAEIVGPLPGELNHITTFAAGVAADSKNADAAKGLVKFLQSPEAAETFKAKGLDPVQ